MILLKLSRERDETPTEAKALAQLVHALKHPCIKPLCHIGLYHAIEFGSFAMREKGGNHMVSGPDYMVDALKLPNHTHMLPEIMANYYRSMCSGVVLMEHYTFSVGRFWSIAGFKRSSC
ncbi:hypothetical protein TNCV_1506591 [Trichonephila clavipes]|nr:hypothetical protein TNCV_1506591 [Trichonephila clavipes]